MTTLKSRLAALGVEVGERPSPMRKIRAENLEDLTQRQRVLIADDLGLYVDYIFSLELACAKLAGEVERRDAAIREAVERECDRVLTAVAQDIGIEYVKARIDGWRATEQALERLQDKLDKIRARSAQEGK